VKKMIRRTSNNLLFLLVMIASVAPVPFGQALSFLGQVSFSLSRAVAGYVAPILLRGVLSIATRVLFATQRSLCSEGSVPAS
jgi:hypothetical protein